jgi:hypothetical protein
MGLFSRLHRPEPSFSSLVEAGCGNGSQDSRRAKSGTHGSFASGWLQGSHAHRKQGN